MVLHATINVIMDIMGTTQMLNVNNVHLLVSLVKDPQQIAFLVVLTNYNIMTNA